MKARKLCLLESRPEMPTALISSNMSFEEQFQNRTLRPIIEFQQDLFLAVFKNYITKHKNMFYSYSVEKKLDYINNAIQKDVKFRNSLKGMVIGQFTLNEYSLYLTNSSALNKRMMNLVKENLQDHIQLLDVAV